MPSKKKKYNARFPPARIKKIMQTDEEVGKVAAPVPVIISRALELFVESLLKKSVQVTMARSAKTLSPAHLKQCVMAESRFDFLRELLASVPDIQGDGEESPLVGILPPTPLSLTPVSPHVYGIPPRTHPLSAPVGEAPAQRGRGRPRGRPRRTQAITPSLGRGAAPKRGLSTTTESEDEDDDSDEDDEDDEEGNSKDSAQVHQPHVPPSWNTFTPAGPSFQPLPVGMPGANQAVALNFYQETSASMAPATAPAQPSVSGASFYTGANGLNLSMNKASASGQSVQGTEDDYDNY